MQARQAEEPRARNNKPLDALSPLAEGSGPRQKSRKA